MTKLQRVNNVLVGLLTVVLAFLMLIDPNGGLKVIGLIISLYLLFSGIRNIRFYFSMARHMVGGKNSLYVGIILIDIDLFMIAMNSVSTVYIILYLLGIHAFSGAVDMMLALDARRMASPSWRLKLVTGIGNIGLAVLAVVYGFVLGNRDAVVYIYSFGLLYSGVMRIINAFRRTAIVYIQ